MKLLLPVANRPVLSYVIELLEASNLKDLIVVIEGDDAALRVGCWISSAFLDRLHVEVNSNLTTIIKLERVSFAKPKSSKIIFVLPRLNLKTLSTRQKSKTGRQLAELCKAEYPTFVKYCLWLLAELAVIAVNIPEGVLITGCNTLLLLGLQKYGARKLMLLISLLVFVMAACYFAEMGYVKLPVGEVLKGMFIPKLKGNGSTGDVIALGLTDSPAILITVLS